MQLLLITLTILQSLLATLEHKTLQADFTISIVEQQTQPMTYSGDLAMHGKQFTLSMLGIEAAYDGSTLYMYNEDLDELSLSTPTEEELTQTNPFLYAQALLPVCQYAEKTVGDKTHITLTPISSSDMTKSFPLGEDLGEATSSPHSLIEKFVLRVTTATLLPTTAEIHETDGKRTMLRLNNAHFTEEKPSFIIEKEGAFINDLR